MMKKHISGLVFLCMVAAAAMFPLSVFSLPSISKSSIKVGMSPRIQKNSWSSLNCSISNPDQKSYEAYLRLVDENTFMGRRTVFSDTLLIPQNAVINYTTEILIEEGENYHVELYVEDKRVPGVDTIIIKNMSEREEQFYILNDSFTVSMGSVNQLEVFKKKTFQLTLPSKDVPFHWSAYKSCLAIVVLRPDFEKYSARQFRGIIDYVKQGGIIIFADPVSTLEAAKTPLAEILPVDPTRIRKISELNSIIPFFPGFKNWGELNLVDFLECYPLENSIVWMKEGQFPVFAWKKFGFGESRFSAVSLSGDVLDKTGAWEKIMMFFLNHQVRFADTKKIMTCLDEMTGYTVPGVAAVKTVFFWYFLMLAVLTAVGMYFRKTNFTLAGSVILSLGVTMWVFNMISAGAANTSSMLVAAIEARYPLSDSNVIDAYYGVFSRKDTIETFNSGSEDVKISSINQSLNRFAAANFGDDPSQGIMSKSQGEPIEVMTSFGVASVSNLNIKANTTRQMNATLSVFRKDDAEKFALPEITYGEKGFSMKDWQAPSDFKFDSAFLTFPSKAYPLTVSAGKVTFNPVAGETYFRGDNISMALADVVRTGFKNTKPGIAFIGGGATGLNFGEKAGCQTRIINFIPVSEKCESSKVSIPSELIVLSAGDTASKSLMPYNDFMTPFNSQNSSDYKISFKLPPEFAMISPEEIEISLSYMNDSNSIVLQPSLMIGAKTIAPDKKSGDKYVFTKDLDKVINPYSGEGVILLSVNVTNSISSISEKLRANKWIMKEFSVGVKGQLRPNIAPFSY